MHFGRIKKSVFGPASLMASKENKPSTKIIDFCAQNLWLPCAIKQTYFFLEMPRKNAWKAEGMWGKKGKNSHIQYLLKWSGSKTTVMAKIYWNASNKLAD